MRPPPRTAQGWSLVSGELQWSLEIHFWRVWAPSFVFSISVPHRAALQTAVNLSTQANREN